jgi:hypothetical protein
MFHAPGFEPGQRAIAGLSSTPISMGLSTQFAILMQFTGAQERAGFRLRPAPHVVAYSGNPGRPGCLPPVEVGYSKMRRRHARYRYTSLAQ